ncbi:MAG: lipopolysaccharide core heptose(I) kinase RfaP [Zoogloeaceae bacterium]|jgi:heptose I phosphotransferase|nr:lipopolysaccharide core heptose(I) kinase RfaP [Zoogloeaceae bacterium]
MKLELHEPFLSLWRGTDPFAAVEALGGTVYRALEGRRTVRVEVVGAAFFAKIHRGIGWGEIIKNLCRLKKPVLGAGNERAAIRRLEAIGVPTLRVAAFGERGGNPARQHSFIITHELAPTIDLETLTRDWSSAPPAFRPKRALIAELARMLGAMHRAGINHRDCYLCHFLLHTDADSGDKLPSAVPGLRISVIDLHRAGIRARTPRRWRDKDLAALHYSALGIGLTRRDVLYFLRHYFQKPLREILREEGASFRGIAWRTRRLVARKARYGDAL